MKSGSIAESAGATLKAAAVAAALACAAGSSMASAVLNITSFTVSTAEFSGQFAYAVNPYQSFSMDALQGGGLLGAATDNFSADNWNSGLNRLAQTANASATGNLVQFTDVATQLTTAGFNLAALASPSNPPPALPNSANASALLSGAFMVLDETGQAAAGRLFFDVYYSMAVSTPGTTPSRYSQTAVGLLSSSDGDSFDFSDQLMSSNFGGGVGTTSGRFSWSYALAAGEAAYYTLSGSAIEVAQVPEPSTVGLVALGLFGACAIRRRKQPEAA